MSSPPATGQFGQECELFYAAKEGDLQRVVLLLNQFESAIPDFRPPYEEDTALIAALREGHVDVATELMVRGRANIEAKGQLNQRALHVAAENGLLAFVRRLLEEGASVSALDYCDRGAIHLACAKGHVDVVGVLVRAGASITDGDSQGRAPLEVASEAGHTAVAELLLSLGASPHARSHIGWTALTVACRHGHLSTVAALLSGGASMDVAEDDTGSSPLHIACLKEHVEIARLLLERGASVTVADAAGGMPLHGAVWSNSPELVALLLRAGAPINATTMEGWTALHVACMRNTQVVEWLLERGAAVNVFDRGGYSPLLYAVTRRSLPTITLLLAHGASPTHPGLSRLATQSTHVEAVKAVEDYIVLVTQEWRPSKNHRYPLAFQSAVKTVMALWSWNREKDSPWHGECGFHTLSLELVYEVFIWLGADIATQGYTYTRA